MRRMLIDLETCRITDFDKDVFRIGRDSSQVDFCADYQAVGVSRIHCHIITREDGFYIVDLNSVNGTSINGIPLEPGREYPLASDDVIRIAGSQYLFLALKGGNDA